jgi:hypothetical protein
MQFNSDTYQITDAGNLGNRLLVVGVIGLILSALGYFVNADRFFFSYLTSFIFWLSIGTGALFFVMLHHLTNAKWSVVLRRLTENIMAALPVMAIFFIPLLFGIYELYHWSHADAVAQDELLQHKEPYLNTTFFIVRSGLYLLVWGLLARALFKVSKKQDEGHTESVDKSMKRISAPGMILFALTLTFASFDWIMSLDSHWYSTIFGVYIFSGSLLAILAVLILVAQHFRDDGILADTITIEHYHDLGKLMFAFVVFWAYIAFSQFMLIWYGNIPEETLFFRHRWEPTGWKIVTLIILFGHFIVPFIALVTRASKRSLKVLMVVAIWILVVHYIDVFWLIVPNYGHGLTVSWMDLTTLVGIGGVFGWYGLRKMTEQPLVAVKDPNLEASINFVNQ